MNRWHKNLLNFLQLFIKVTLVGGRQRTSIFFDVEKGSKEKEKKGKGSKQKKSK